MCEKDDFMLNSPQSNYIFKIKKKNVVLVS